jgi:hypothetical protein
MLYHNQSKKKKPRETCLTRNLMTPKTVFPTTLSRSNQFPNQFAPVALSLGLKRPGHEADQLPPSSVEYKNAWSYTSISPHILWHGT